MDSVEKSMESAIPKEDSGATQESVGDLITAINEFISTLDDGEITWLTAENVQGLEEACVYQLHLLHLFGWSVDAITELIRTKLIFTKSINGRLLEAKLKALGMLQTQISAHIETPLGLTDKLMGAVPEKK